MKNRIFSMVLVMGFLAVWSLFGLTSRAGALTPTLSPTPIWVGCGTVVVVTSTPSPTFTPTPRTATATATACGPIYITATPSVPTLTPTATGALPDLVITSIFWSPSKPQLGQTITLSAIIRNNGSAASPAGVIHDVRFTISGSGVAGSTTRLSSTYTQSIAPGGSVTVQADTTWFPTIGDNYTVFGEVDFGQRIAESNESNNSYTAPTQVILKPTPLPPTYTRTPTPTATCSTLTVTGFITNALTMQGIAGATIVADTSVLHPFDATTAADGSYVLSIPGASNYACEVTGLRIWATGYQERDVAIGSAELFAQPQRSFSLLPNATPTITPTRTLTPTPTKTGGHVPPTLTPTRTLTPTSGVAACSPVSATITTPFTFDGAGTFCWQAGSLGSYVNSWNTASVTINGVNVTNLYVASGSYPAKLNGFYYVSYKGNFAWSHFEAK